jgi:hypothetical protein
VFIYIYMYIYIHTYMYINSYLSIYVGRMKAKGCISEVLEWPTAREFFYWRIRRRQVEDPLKV